MPYWLDLDIQPIRGEDAALINFIAVESDISELKQMTSELSTARDQAEVAARAKADFMAIMSHEIRTPLNGVMGNVELLLESPLSNEQRGQLESVRVCGEFLHALINDVLDFSKN